jgi:very-short-patch-repair endonuclease
MDFLNLENKVVIELDGGQRALRSGDRIRDEWLLAEGYEVPKFWYNEVFINLGGVLETIRDARPTRRPDLSPAGEGI